MLKIKDDVDLKELAKKYNMVYCEDYRTPYEDDNYGWIMQVPDEAFKIWWRDDLNTKGELRININYKTTDEAVEKLYDLIQADLVEKVEE
jgi:hypothetical protein